MMDKSGSLTDSKYIINLDSEIIDNDRLLNISQKSNCRLLKKIFLLSTSEFFNLFIENLTSLMCLIFISKKLETLFLDSTGLGLSIFQLFVIYPSKCLVSSLDTLASQSFGKKNYKDLVSYLYISTIVSLIVDFILSIIFFISPLYLTLFENDKRLIALTIPYLNRMIPLIFLNSGKIIIKSFFTSQLANYYIMIISFIQNIIELCTCYLLLYNFELGYFGYLYSMYIGDSLLLIISLCYIIFSKKFNYLTFKIDLPKISLWIKLISIGLPSFILGFFEYSGFYLLFFMTGRLGNDILAANTILENLFNLLMIFPTSIGYSLTILIGISLARQKIKKSKQFIYISFIFLIVINAIVFAVLISLKSSICLLFVDDYSILHMIEDTYKFMIIFFLLESFTTQFQNILIGCGLQVSGEIIGICANSIPIFIFGYIFLFYFKWGLDGFWISASFASILYAIAFIIDICFIDLNKISQNITKGLNNSVNLCNSAAI